MKGKYFLNRKNYCHTKFFMVDVNIVQYVKKLLSQFANFLFFIRI